MSVCVCMRACVRACVCARFGHCTDPFEHTTWTFWNVLHDFEKEPLKFKQIKSDIIYFEQKAPGGM